MTHRKLSRREMLRQASLVTVGLAATAVPGWPKAWFRTTETVVPFTDIPPGFTTLRSEEHERLPGENLMAQDLRELESWLTPSEDFFTVGHYAMPELDQGSYRLDLFGLLDRPVSLTLEDLRRRERVERTTVFECAGNSRVRLHGMVGNATWTGADLGTILDEVGPTSGADHVHFWAADTGVEEIRGAEVEQNFARSMSLADVRGSGPILAYEMNGEPLPVVHGFPVRLIVPGWYGIAQVKWLERIELSDRPLMTRFMARDYVTLIEREVDGRREWIETSVTRQRVKSAIARVTREGDRFTIFGAAWTDGTPLDRVDISIDDGEWEPAALDSRGDDYTWTFFTFKTTGLAPGEHTIVSRATDARGRSQPDDLSMKRTRWENNELFPRNIEVS